MKVVYFGTPEFAVPTLDALVESRHEVVLVVSKPDRLVGRRKVMTSPPVIEVARRLDVPTEQPKGFKGGGFDDILVGCGAEIAVVVAYGKLIPKSLLTVPPRGFVNLHPSLLPRHRGPSPIQWTLVCGDRTTGVTTMQLDEGMDTGPVLLQERLAIEPMDTAETLSPRLAEFGARLMVATLDGLEDGTVEPRPQPEDGANVTPMLRRTFAKVDWTMPARQLVNRLRGFTPWPGLYTKFRGGRLKIFGLEEVRPAPAGREEAGVVLDAGPPGILIRCGRGSAALITEMQREGRRRLPADAFLIGERVSRGEVFG
jgi:methionyl-tRNA formyltransferase